MDVGIVNTDKMIKQKGKIFLKGYIGIPCAILTFVCVKSFPNRKLVCSFNGLGAGWVSQQFLVFSFQWHIIYSQYIIFLNHHLQRKFLAIMKFYMTKSWHRVTGLTESGEVILTSH